MTRTAGEGSSAAPRENYPQLLSLAVHELRSPASVVGGYLRMLQREIESPLSERQRKMIDEAEKSCARLVALIAELSDISKLDSGLVSLAREPLDLFPLIAEVVELVQEAKDRDVRLEIRGETHGAQISGDAARLRSAFDVIFRSILREKAGPATIVVERRRETRDGQPTAVVVVAEETSVQAAHDRAVAPFDEQRGGLGLQLPLARRIFEGHGGHLAQPAGSTAAGPDDRLPRGSAIVSLPITE